MSLRSELRPPGSQPASRPASPPGAMKMPLALATAPTQVAPPMTPPSPRGRIRWSGRGPAGAGATGIDSGGVADGSANLVASVVLRGAEEGLHTRQMRPLCVAPAPKQPDPALD